MTIVVKTISAEARFQTRLSNKNIFHVIFIVGNIDGWLYHNRIFSFKTKMLVVARYAYITVLKIPSTIGP